MVDDITQGTQSYLRVDSPTFGRVDRTFIIRTFELAVRRFRRRLLRLVDDLSDNDITVPRFVNSATELVRTEYGLVFALGALSIDSFHILTDQDRRVLNDELEQERRFLRSFAEDLRSSNLVLTTTQRAGLYLQALRGVFELGRIQALPLGPYDWVLGLTEHCNECEEAALGGPYQKDRFSGLGLPSLPGVPGSGEVCRGLTRCGCRISLSGTPIPNSDVQVEVKNVLAEVLNDSG
jgi:hypothetical protein